MKGSGFLAEKIVDEILSAESQSREQIALANENAEKAIEEAKLQAKERAGQIIEKASKEAAEIVADAEKQARILLEEAEKKAVADSKKACSIGEEKKKESIRAVIDCIFKD